MEYKISSRQMLLLMIIYRLSISIAYMPVRNIAPGNQDIWIMLILSMFYSLIIKAPLMFLANRFSQYTLTQSIENILGKFLGKFVSILLGLYFLAYAIFLMLIQVELVGAAILPFTSNIVMIGIFIVTALYIGSKDIMTIMWVGELTTPINLASIIFLIFAGVNQVDYKILLPILADSKFLEMNLGAIMVPFIFPDIFVLSMNVPYLENKQDINKIFVKSILYSTIIAVAAIIVTQTTLGVEQTKHSNYPFLIYTRLINFRSVLERIDPIFVITWLSSNILKITTFIHLSSIVFMECLGMRNNKKIFYIITLLIAPISMYISIRYTIIPLSKVINRLVVFISAIFITVIPTLVAIVYFFRRKTLDREKKVQN